MGLPIYQIQMHQKAPPITRYTEITQKTPNWPYQLENIKSLQKKSAKYKKMRNEKWVLRNGSSNLSDSNVPKGPILSETYRHYSRNPQIGLCN